MIISVISRRRFPRRRRRRPVTAEVLAEEQGVSVRTLYRDIQALVALGAVLAASVAVVLVKKKPKLGVLDEGQAEAETTESVDVQPEEKE